MPEKNNEWDCLKYLRTRTWLPNIVARKDKNIEGNVLEKTKLL